jgi:Domain of unknown function (DUF5597)
VKGILVLDGEQPQPVSMGGYQISLASRTARPGGGRGGAPIGAAPAAGPAGTAGAQPPIPAGAGAQPPVVAAPLLAGGVSFGSRAMPDDNRPFALVVQTGPDEFLFMGANGTPSFAVDSPGPSKVAISSKDEGRFEKGKWVPGRRLNGDEAGTGLPNTRIGMLKIRLVRFD